MITKENLKTYLFVQDAINDRINSILLLLEKYETGNNYLRGSIKKINIGEQEVNITTSFNNEQYWTEYIYYTFPTEAIYNHEWDKEQLERIKNKKSKAQIASELNDQLAELFKAKEASKALELEKIEYERLKRKFDSEGAF